MSQEIVSTVPSDFLSDLGDALANTPEPMTRGRVPEGNYSARLVEVYQGQAKADNSPFISLTFEILSGSDEWIGTPVKVVWGVRNPTQIEILKRNLRGLGIMTNDAAVVSSQLTELTGETFNITVKHKDAYQNVFVNRPE